MSKKILETLFNSRARVRLLRFLFRNYPKSFTVKELSRHLQESTGTMRKEILKLQQISLLNKDNGKK